MLRAFPLRAAAFETHPDDALVAAAQAHPAEFAALYERYFPRVYRYLAARTGNPEDAADLAQGVFLDAFDALGRFRPGKTSFASWLFRIARNAAIDAHRRKRPSFPLEFASHEPETSASPEGSALRTERLEELQRHLAAIDPRHRDLLALRYAGGLTAAEISALVGKSPEGGEEATATHAAAVEGALP